MKPVTIRELEFVRNNYNSMTAAQIAVALGCCVKRVQNICCWYKIRLPDELRKKRRPRPKNFKLGHEPYNKGSKGCMKPNRTSFKPGQEPHNTKHDGAISIRTDNRDVPYQFIRVEKGKWVPLHRHLWEQAHGPIPPQHIVIFADGDTMNCELSNLRLISRAENAKRNANHEKRAITIRKHIVRVALIKANGLQPKFSKYRLTIEKAKQIRDEFLNDNTHDSTDT
jgi:hypothetical protein